MTTDMHVMEASKKEVMKLSRQGLYKLQSLLSLEIVLKTLKIKQMKLDELNELYSWLSETLADGEPDVIAPEDGDEGIEIDIE